MSNKQAWKLEKDEHGIAWLHLNVQGKSANTLSQLVLSQLDKHLTAIAKADHKGLVILSDKPAGFIAGADVEEFTHITTTESAEEVMHKAHATFNAIASLNMPTLALIHGHCLGGGLELSLACDYRIAENESSLGFPEVMLGIFPGFGGSVRSIQKVGVVQAMRLMLSGRPLDARRAVKIGLIDDAVPERQMKRAAMQTILNASPHRKQGSSWAEKLLTSQLGRSVLAYWLRKETQKRVNPKHYPAPFALINMWQKYGGNAQVMFVQEVKAVAKLLVLPQTQNLIRLFFLRERLKSFGKTAKDKVSHVHVIGAGVMGGDIAAWCALQGIKVTLQDQNIAIVGKAINRASSLFQKKLRVPRLVQAAMDRLIPDLDGKGLKEADIVLEAIVENLKTKQSLYQSIEPQMKKGAMLATNTSGIPIDDLAKTMKTPSRLIGIHFFNPVAQMMLVEVIASQSTSKKTSDAAFAFVTQIRKLPLPVKSSPGFLINRILMPYLIEAVHMVEEGVSPLAIDKAALEFGMPMGPITLADTVGLDICLAVANDLSSITDDKTPSFLKQWVESGRLGVKSGQGFYTYEKGRMVDAKEKYPTDNLKDIEHRLITRIIHEANLCLEEGVVSDADLLDAGMVFGAGFAPFRGGVMQYAKQRETT